MIDLRAFRGLDLNQLLVFAALMEERSVSRAAERLFLGQSAVSMSLRRLRERLGDELLVRTPRGMAPTARALALWQEIEPVVATLERVLTRPAATQSPDTFQGRVRLAMSDDHEAFLLPRLLARVRAHAPGLQLVFRQSDRHRAAGQLERHEAEVVVAPGPAPADWIDSRPLAALALCCVAHPSQVPLDGLTLARYVATPHLMVAFDGEPHSRLDDALVAQGLRRQVLAAAAHFLALGPALQATPAIATVPVHAAAALVRAHGLRAAPLPLALAPVAACAWTHRRHRGIAALEWVVEEVAALYRPLEGQPLERAMGIEPTS